MAERFNEGMCAVQTADEPGKYGFIDKNETLVIPAVFDEAKQLKPDIKVLFTSGYPADLIAKQGVLEQEINFIAKPSPTNKILTKIRELLDQTTT